MAEVDLDAPIDLTTAGNDLFLRWNVRQCALAMANTLGDAQLLEWKTRQLRMSHLEMLATVVISEWLNRCCDRYKALGLRSGQNEFALQSTEDFIRDAIGKIPGSS